MKLTHSMTIGRAFSAVGFHYNGWRARLSAGNMERSIIGNAAKKSSVSMSEYVHSLTDKIREETPEAAKAVNDLPANAAAGSGVKILHYEKRAAPCFSTQKEKVCCCFR